MQFTNRFARITMPAGFKRHIRFAFSSMVIALLFLGGPAVFTDAAGKPENIEFRLADKQLADDCENGFFQASHDDQTVGDFSLRQQTSNRNLKKESAGFQIDLIEKTLATGFSSLQFLYRPAYYVFLFLHYLF